MPTPLLRGALLQAAGRPGIRLGNVYYAPPDGSYLSGAGYHECARLENGLLLIAAVIASTTSTPTVTITVNGATPTLVGRSTVAVSPYIHCMLWRVLNPARRQDIAISVPAATSNYLDGYSVDFGGVNQTTPLGTLATGNNSSGAAAAELSVTASAGDAIFDALYSGAGNPYGRQAAIARPGSTQIGASWLRVAAAGANTMGWSFLGGGSVYAMLAVAIKPA